MVKGKREPMATATAILPGRLSEVRVRRMLDGAMRLAGATDDQISQTQDIISDVRAKGVSWLEVLAVIVPIILSLLSGEPLDFEKIIALILSLLTG